MIEIRNVSKRYGDGSVVDDVTLTVEPRTIAAIVGTSGSGKTTLMRMINRMTEPSAGAILIDGVDNRTIKGPELRRRIGYVIQDHGLFPHRTVAENIATVPRLLGWDRRRREARTHELLELFGLDPALFAGRFPHELSGGQQQRVGVARALAAKPNILLMDEPFGALDPIIRAKAQADLLAVQKATGTTIILVTHDMEEAVHLGARIAVLDAGRLVQYARPVDILSRPASPFVEEMIGSGDRAFKVLSLETLEALAEPGTAAGPPIPVGATRRDALADLLWTGRASAPVTDAAGRPLGIVTAASLIAAAARPAA
ncbi:ABC transporter ATP-binding protein [Aureimonas pseudogalii]|uniref:Osmoprotectant transport system ATP-binding protein n=1 Tax=Aureimonas pseudogalii TaxID=1744844 RepID=A0A7W6MKI5_9HYPH|nr:ABC transporter ATP-binding protein [Aureimonas pseudogalii]MBB3999044.1 osmoprotectant transport system ATP-binding protein [Aureimonas pseudogalii]